MTEEFKMPSTKGLVKQDSFDLYLREISKIPVLTKEQEHALALKWVNERDREAGQKLVLANLRFVVKIAKEYSKYGFKMSDLVQEGNLGLMHAVDKYDPTKGHRLITYAVWWIRAYMQSFILRSWSMVRLGTTRLSRKLFGSLQKARQQISHMSGGEEATQKQLAEVLGVDEKEMSSTLNQIQKRDLSLDQPLNAESEASVGESMADPKMSAEDRLIEGDIERKIKIKMLEVYDKLQPRERYLLEHRLMSDDPKTLEEVGKEFGITRERVRQLEARLLGKLKTELEPTILDVPAK